MNKWIYFVSLVLFLTLNPLYGADKVFSVSIEGAISPATADYVTRAIRKSEQDQAAALIIRLNTPGGLETSMRSITEAMIAAEIPVVTFVAPSGARAASAGTFIVYASHLAFMAPGTNIGAASPVSMLGTKDGGSKSQKIAAAENKAMNDAAAYIRSLAQLNGRNINFAEAAVRQALSLSATDAKRQGVINDIAQDQADLLQKINDQVVNIKGKKTTIKVTTPHVETIEPDWRYNFLLFITNPNIAYILMLIAMYGLFFELSNPGAILPGVLGTIALLLVLYAFQLMPINYTGLALMLVGLLFIIFEIYVTSFGVLGLGGVIAFILGSIMLFDINDPHYQVAWGLLVIMSLLTAAFFFMVVALAIRSHKKAVVTGQEGLIGSEGVVLSVTGEQVVIRVMGEIWEAETDALLQPGQHVMVKQIHGLNLIVEPIDQTNNDLKGV